MRHYSLLKTIPLSFHSRDLYRDVGREWEGFAFGYLLLMLTLCTVPVLLWAMMMCFTVTLDQPFNANYVINQIPEMKVANGELSVAVPQPYFIKMQDGEVIAVIDTTRPVTESVPPGKSMIVFGKKEILVSDAKKNEKKLYDMPGKLKGIYTSGDARFWAQKILGYLWVLPLLCAPFFLGIVYIYRIIEMYIYGLCGFAMSGLMGARLSYMSCVRLASVAITPICIVQTVIMAFPPLVPAGVWFLFAMGYLFYAVRANAI